MQSEFLFSFVKHFRFRKVTPDVKKRMLVLAENKLSFYAIAKRLGFDPSTVEYHLVEEKRNKALERAKRSFQNHSQSNDPEFFLQALAEKKRVYNRKYLGDRYNKDPDFRLKIIRANNGGRFKEEED